MDARAKSLYGTRDVFRYLAVAALTSTFFLRSERAQIVAGIAFLLALWCAYQTGEAAKSIQEAKDEWQAETDPQRKQRAHEKFEWHVSRSLWNILKP